MTSTVEPKLVLYIDDDELSALLVDRVLRIRGYKVVHKSTGLEGLEAAETVTPQIILINISLPDLNRRIITARLRYNEKLAGVSIIALVPLRGEEAREMSATFGCDGYITKPIDADWLPDQVEQFFSNPPRISTALRRNDYLPAYNAQLVQKLENRVKELTETNQTLLILDQQRATLFNAISDELRMPLHPIKDHVTRLLDGSYGELKQEQHQALKTISGHTTLLSYLMADLACLSRFKANKIVIQPIAFDFNHLLNEIIALTEVLFEQSVVRFEYNIDNNLPKMYADRDGIKRVFLYLLNDTVKSTQQGAVTLTVTTTDNNVQVSISNISNNFTDSKVRTASWLAENEMEVDSNLEPGVFISKYILEAHNGTVWANSGQGREMTYTFALPFRELASTKVGALAA